LRALWRGEDKRDFEYRYARGGRMTPTLFSATVAIAIFEIIVCITFVSNRT